MTGTGFTELLQNGLPYLLMGVFPAGCLTLFVAVQQYVQALGRRLSSAQRRIEALESRLAESENRRESPAPSLVPAPRKEAGSRQLTQAESGFLAEVDRYLSAHQHGTGMVV